MQSALQRAKEPYEVTLTSGTKLKVPTIEHVLFAPSGYWIIYEDNVLSYDVDPQHVVSVKGEPRRKTS